LRQWSNALLTDNEIIDNNSILGAGVHVTYTSAPTIRNNLIAGNIAGNLGGGGIYVYYLSQPLIERNTITENTSPTGAGIGVFYTSAGTIRDNLIFNNKEGDGIYVTGRSFPTIVSNTITKNFKNGIECQANTYPVITGNIITSNGTTGYGIRVEPNSWPVIKYNNIWGNPAGNTGPAIPDQTGLNGNISADPVFLDIDANDYHLAQNSPCINAGDPNYAPGSNQADYDGDSRLAGGRIDIGADEVKPAWNITGNKDYDTIQQAIDDSNDIDVIAITAGTHTGTGNRDIDFDGKAITVQSIDPNLWEIVAATIIDCNGSSQNPHSGFYFDSGEDHNSIIAGITIIRSAGPSASAIRCNNSSPAIKNCIIKDNLSDSGSGAGVCALDDSSPAIINCFLSNNHASGSDSNGGAISFQNGSDGLVANCILTANTAGNSGGAMAASSSSPEYINCTIIGNNAPAGGALSSSGQSHPNVANCIIRDNLAADGNQLAVINTGAAAEMTVSFSDVKGGFQQAKVDPGCTLNWGSGNIDLDPNFVNPGYWDQGNLSDPNDDFFVSGNYHLLPSSLCVDAGDTGSIPLLVTSDIDGEQRIFNTIIDMGADEMVTNTFDLDADGFVGYPEIEVLADEWLLTELHLQADFNSDGTVNLGDFALLAEQWLWTAGWHQ
jgi:parallel beta-helix repeat protein